MSNNYIPTTWIGSKTIGTADVMNNIEQGIGSAHDRLDGVDVQFNTIDKYNKNNLSKLIEKMRNNEIVTIVCFGDSTTYGYTQNGTQTEKNYPAILQAKLRYIYNNNNINVINTGLSGQTIIGAMSYFQNRVLSYNPDLVIIMFGLNDLAQNIKTNDYEDKLREIIKKSKDINSKVIVCSPMASTVVNKSGFSSDYNVNLKNYAISCKRISTELEVSFVDMYSEFTNLNKSGSITYDFYDSVVHVHLADYTIMADILLKNALSIYECEHSVGSIIPCYSPFVNCSVKSFAKISGTKLGYYFNINNATNDNIKFAIWSDGNTKLKMYYLKNKTNTTGINIKNFGNVVATTTDDNTQNINDVAFEIPLNLGFNFIELNSTDLTDLSKLFCLSGFEVITTILIQEDATKDYQLTLQNNWVSGQNGFNSIKCTKNKNIINITGTLASGTLTKDTIITTVPVETRSATSILFGVSTSSTGNDCINGFIYLNKNGELKIFSSNLGNNFMCLNLTYMI